MNIIFRAVASRVARVYQTGTIMLASFLALRLDGLMSALGYLEGALDDFVSQQEARIIYNDSAAQRSFRRENDTVISERALRSDLDNDSEEARSEIGKAIAARRKVRRIIDDVR